jgi:transcriptional regulator with XRE-family HTH domain
MWMKKRNSLEDNLAAYDSEMLRSAFVSLFWGIISFKKAHGAFSLKSLAEKIGVNKSQPTRWFSGSRPNWTVNTIAAIASALGVTIEIRARDESGMVFAPHGPVERWAQPEEITTTPLPGQQGLSNVPAMTTLPARISGGSMMTLYATG